MYLLFVSACACAALIFWIYPGTKQTVLCVVTNATASAVDLCRAIHSSTEIYLEKIKHYLYDRYNLINEIIHRYRTGEVSLRTLMDFTLFKCRIYSTELFENGLVIDRGGPNIEIIYYIRDTRHRIVTPKRAGLRPILRINGSITRSSEIDLREKLGPYGNFHGIPTTPAMLGYSDINVTYRQGRRNITYSDDEVINVNGPD